MVRVLEKHQIRACMRRIRRYASVCVCKGPGAATRAQATVAGPATGADAPGAHALVRPATGPARRRAPGETRRPPVGAVEAVGATATRDEVARRVDGVGLRAAAAPVRRRASAPPRAPTTRTGKQAAQDDGPGRQLDSDQYLLHGRQLDSAQLPVASV